MAKKRKSKSKYTPVYLPKPKGRTEAEVLLDLRRVAGEKGFIHSLALIAMMNTMVFGSSDGITVEDFARIYDKRILIKNELKLVQSAQIAKPLSTEIPSLSDQYRTLVEVSQLLAELHGTVLEPGTADFIAAMKAKMDGEAPPSPLLKGSVMREGMFYGAESAFTYQYLAFAVERYKQDNEWLQKNRGFTIEENVTVFRAIIDLKLENFSNRSAFSPESQGEDGKNTLLPIFCFTVDQLVDRTGLPVASVAAILSAYSAKPPVTLGDPDIISEVTASSKWPIIELGVDKFASFIEYALCEAVYDNPFYWMIADPAYKDRLASNRGQFAERFVEDVLLKVFPASSVLSNVEFYSGKSICAEADLILLRGKRAFIFQVKSKKLTDASKRGDEVAIDLDFGKAVRSALGQAIECGKAILSKKRAKNHSGDVTAALSNVDEIFPICVTSEHYPSLSFQAGAFLENLVLSAGIHYPYITDIFTFDVITEFIKSRLHFVDYLVKRSRAADRIHASHELVVLSWYLKKNLHIEDNTMFYLEDDILAELDQKFAIRRAGIAGDPIIKGQLTRYDGTTIGKILAEIESTDNASVFKVGEFLLGCDGDTAEFLERGLTQILAAAKSDSKRHDISMGMSGSSGITFHAAGFVSRDMVGLLQSHCESRKHIERADSWYGVLLNSSGEVHAFVGLEFPFKEDAVMDEATRDMRAFGVVNNTVKRRKIGANEPCPCGSGKKFKKCHRDLVPRRPAPDQIW